MQNSNFDYDKEFQKKLREYVSLLRKERKKTMEEVSDYLSISKALYSRYEKGSRNIPLSILRNICEYYGVDYYKSFQIIDMNVYSNSMEDIKIIQSVIKPEINQDGYLNLTNRIDKIERILKIKE